MRLLSIVFETKVEEDNVFDIPAQNVWNVQDQVNKLNKKAEKLGTPPIQLEILDKFQRVKPGIDPELNPYPPMITYYKMRVIGQSPKLEGWELIGALDYVNDEVIIRAVPGKTIPEEFRNTTPTRCDYCKTKRDRVNSYIVQHENGDVQQVGRSCLKNFLGHKDPKAILSFATMIRELMDGLEDEEHDWGGKGGRRVSTYDLQYTLALTAAAIEQFGWVSGGAARQDESGRLVATSSQVDNQLNYNRLTRQEKEQIPKLEPTKKHYDIADEAIEWVRNVLSKQERKGEYEHNLVALAKADHFEAKYLGFVVSIIKAKERAAQSEKERAIKKQEWDRINSERKEKAKTSDYYGEIGTKFGGKNGPPLRVKLLKIREFGGQYGGPVRLHQFEDENGNFYIWFANTNPEMEEGSWYNIAGTVKAHQLDKYNNNAKTTTLTRVRVE